MSRRHENARWPDRESPFAALTRAVAGCVQIKLAAAETSNKPTIKKFIHLKVMKGCQPILGCTSLEVALSGT
ncbi:hypothetical protein [Paracoccus albus]|uniref:hypothetical protein n=1 Tax=Paracoccus albus TaxID=3017784 RepID=UPI0022F02C6B|nr:hypothetical protein [Paracoccus albus]WBU59085.1 hypothetical protein PAF20_09730 [Paracoccus albus]